MSRTTRLVGALLLLLWFAPIAQAAMPSSSPPPLRIGLTPVFLDDQAAFLDQWRAFLQVHLKRRIIFVQRGSYREIVDLLRDGKLEFAWLCGYPYVRDRNHFRLAAVPLYRGEPLYHSYLIVPAGDMQTRSINDLRGKIFAFSDPDSNSGHLYPEYLLAKQGLQPASFFAKGFYTWSHRKVVEAVASGLAQGGAVDGYVWDTLSRTHPELTARTRIVTESPQFGFPPIVASRSVSKRNIAAFQEVLFGMVHDDEGAYLLDRLNINGFVYGDNRLYDSIADMFRFVDKQRLNASQGH
ncbi:MAG TPA: PhnD/SsuA/transferrin family substrate-binding protein [Sideroxyarcus sp.]|nr:PhnD/SsuA/transferrin family substrate-binding protein [Sideroxyarcus sp.]